MAAERVKALETNTMTATPAIKTTMEKMNQEVTPVAAMTKKHLRESLVEKKWRR